MELKRTARSIAAGTAHSMVRHGRTVEAQAMAGASFSEAIRKKYVQEDDWGFPPASFVYYDPERDGEAGEQLRLLVNHLLTLNQFRISLTHQTYMKNYYISLRERCEEILQSFHTTRFWRPEAGELAAIYREILSREGKEVSVEAAQGRNLSEAAERRLLAIQGRVERRMEQNLPGSSGRGQNSLGSIEGVRRPLGQQSSRMAAWASDQARLFFWRVQRAPAQEQRVILRASGVSSLAALMKRLSHLDPERWRRESERIRTRVEEVLRAEEELRVEKALRAEEELRAKKALRTKAVLRAEEVSQEEESLRAEESAYRNGLRRFLEICSKELPEVPGEEQEEALSYEKRAFFQFLTDTGKAEFWMNRIWEEVLRPKGIQERQAANSPFETSDSSASIPAAVRSRVEAMTAAEWTEWKRELDRRYLTGADEMALEERTEILARLRRSLEEMPAAQKEKTERLLNDQIRREELWEARRLLYRQTAEAVSYLGQDEWEELKQELSLPVRIAEQRDENAGSEWQEIPAFVREKQVFLEMLEEGAGSRQNTMVGEKGQSAENRTEKAISWLQEWLSEKASPEAIYREPDMAGKEPAELLWEKADQSLRSSRILSQYIHWDEENSVRRQVPAQRDETPVRKDEIPAWRGENSVRWEEMSAQRRENPVRQGEVPARRDDENPARGDEMPVRKDEIPARRGENSAWREEMSAQRRENPVQQDGMSAQRDDENPAWRDEIPARRGENSVRWEEMSAQRRENPARQDGISAQRDDENPARRNELSAWQETIPAQREQAEYPSNDPIQQEELWEARRLLYRQTAEAVSYLGQDEWEELKRELSLPVRISEQWDADASPEWQEIPAFVREKQAFLEMLEEGMDSRQSTMAGENGQNAEKRTEIAVNWLREWLSEEASPEAIYREPDRAGKEPAELLWKKADQSLRNSRILSHYIHWDEENSVRRETVSARRENPERQDEVSAHRRENSERQEEIPARRETPAQREAVSERREETSARQEEIPAQRDETPVRQEENPAQRERGEYLSGDQMQREEMSAKRKEESRRSAKESANESVNETSGVGSWEYRIEEMELEQWFHFYQELLKQEDLRPLLTGAELIHTLRQTAEEPEWMGYPPSEERFRTVEGGEAESAEYPEPEERFRVGQERGTVFGLDRESENSAQIQENRAFRDVVFTEAGARSGETQENESVRNSVGNSVRNRLASLFGAEIGALGSSHVPRLRLQGAAHLEYLLGQGSAGVSSGVPGISGMSGVPGMSGVSGMPGAPGFSGMQGVSGVSGLLGASGVQGFSGLPGASGVQGFSGMSGASGMQGFSGLPGASGVQGLSGMSGASGLMGASGLPGQAALSLLEHLRSSRVGLAAPDPMKISGGETASGGADAAGKDTGEGLAVSGEERISKVLLSNSEAAKQSMERTLLDRQSIGRRGESAVPGQSAAGRRGESFISGQSAAGRRGEPSISGQSAAGRRNESSIPGQSAVGRRNEPPISGQSAAGQEREAAVWAEESAFSYDPASMVISRSGGEQSGNRNRSSASEVQERVEMEVTRQVKEQVTDIRRITRDVPGQGMKDAETSLKDLIRQVESQQKELEALRQKQPPAQETVSPSKLSKSVMRRMENQLRTERLRRGL